ncbi:MAG: nicotinamide riboside transporter PnuC [Candidatus Gastranaerophilales bacterium]
MSIKDFLSKEFSNWKRFEIVALLLSFILIFYCAIQYNDSPVAVTSAICGILYTIIAGKGKISCYAFGLLGSGCYSYLAFHNALWGNLLLYLYYYIPMQIFGIYRWSRHLSTDTKEIIKTKLTPNELVGISIFTVVGFVASVYLLKYFNGGNPIFDSLTTILSIVGMYLTVKRCIEQWIIWVVVNGLSFVMWLELVLNGSKAYATVIMWGVYFILAIYFYYTWKKEMKLSNL